MNITCEELVKYLSDYLENELDTELAQAAEEHLATCENCRVVLDSTRKTILLYKQHGAVVQIPARRKGALFDQIARAFAEKDQQEP